MPELPYPLWNAGPAPALLASREREGGDIVFPALAPASPLNALHDTVALDGVGEVYSYTVIHPGARSGEAPYALGLVDLPGPVRLFGRLVGRPHPAIGDRCRARPDDTYGYVFVAVEA